MVSDRASLVVLLDLIADTDLTLETIPTFCEPNGALPGDLRATLSLADDLIKQQRMTAAAVLGDKGGSTTAKRIGDGGCAKDSCWWKAEEIAR